MARHLRLGARPADAAEAKKVRDIVTGVLEDIESRGETALREICREVRQSNPPTFRLFGAGDRGMFVPALPTDIDDIKFAQAQDATLPRRERSSMKDHERRDLAGSHLGHKNMPVDSVGCYVPGGKFRWWRPPT